VKSKDEITPARFPQPFTPRITERLPGEGMLFANHAIVSGDATKVPLSRTHNDMYLRAAADGVMRTTPVNPSTSKPMPQRIGTILFSILSDK